MLSTGSQHIRHCVLIPPPHSVCPVAMLCGSLVGQTFLAIVLARFHITPMTGPDVRGPLNRPLCLVRNPQQMFWLSSGYITGLVNSRQYGSFPPSHAYTHTHSFSWRFPSRAISRDLGFQWGCAVSVSLLSLCGYQVRSTDPVFE